MKIVKSNSLLFLYWLIAMISCTYEILRVAELNEEKMEVVAFYFDKLEAENIDIQAIVLEDSIKVLPVTIANSQSVYIDSLGKIINANLIDTMATFLWDAIENKAAIDEIRVGILDVNDKNFVQKTKYFWLRYPTGVWAN